MVGGEGSTKRIDALACSFWTRVARHRTTEPTMGRELFREEEVDGRAELKRGTEMTGLLFLSDGGVVILEPTIEA